jgi:hypothetical protein
MVAARGGLTLRPQRKRTLPHGDGHVESIPQAGGSPAPSSSTAGTGRSKWTLLLGSRGMVTMGSIAAAGEWWLVAGKRRCCGYQVVSQGLAPATVS